MSDYGLKNGATCLFDSRPESFILITWVLILVAGNQPPFEGVPPFKGVVSFGACRFLRLGPVLSPERAGLRTWGVGGVGGGGGHCDSESQKLSHLR